MKELQLGRLYRTVKHLRWQQLFYRFYYPLKKLWYSPKDLSPRHLRSASHFPSVRFPSFSSCRQIYNPYNHTFKFLNLAHSFEQAIDWNFAAHGKLWTYHLNYFEWLNDQSISVAERYRTICQYVLDEVATRDGMEAYPASLRIMNWIKFISENKVGGGPVIASLYRQSHRLYHFIEYHIMANHLLENGLALIWAGYYFDEQYMWEKGLQIVNRELREQILGDGAHYERSAMYHLLLMQHLMELIVFLEAANRPSASELLDLLREKSALMLAWAKAFAFSNNSYAGFGDSMMQLTPELVEFEKLAQDLLLKKQTVILDDSGYRKIAGQGLEFVFNCGAIKPGYQPGHAHSDLFSFCMHVDGQPLIVDTGVSTYERNERRMQERSTPAHNTLAVAVSNSSEVWSSFRVGRRAIPTIHTDTPAAIVASHAGYMKKFGLVHQRGVRLKEGAVEIEDILLGAGTDEAMVYLHFHPDIKVRQEGAHRWVTEPVRTVITFSDAVTEAEAYEFSRGFNDRVPATRIVARLANKKNNIIIEQNSWSN